MTNEMKRPPFDPAYKNGVQPLNPNKILNVPAVRQGIQAINPGADGIAAKHPQYELTNIKVPGIPGLSDTTVDLALYLPRPEAGRKWPDGRPLVYHVHGGGQMGGDR